MWANNLFCNVLLPLYISLCHSVRVMSSCLHIGLQSTLAACTGANPIQDSRDDTQSSPW